MKPPIIARREQRDIEIAKTVLAKNTIAEIREYSLKRLARLKLQGFNFNGFDEWVNVFESGTDDDVIRFMTSMDEKYITFRKSPPYSGIHLP